MHDIYYILHPTTRLRDDAHVLLLCTETIGNSIVSRRKERRFAQTSPSLFPPLKKGCLHTSCLLVKGVRRGGGAGQRGPRPTPVLGKGNGKVKGEEGPTFPWPRRNAMQPTRLYQLPTKVLHYRWNSGTPRRKQSIITTEQNISKYSLQCDGLLIMLPNFPRLMTI